MSMRRTRCIRPATSSVSSGGSTQVKASYRNVEGGVPVSSNQWFCYADEFIGELKRNKEQNNDQRSDVTYMERTGVSDMYEKGRMAQQVHGRLVFGDAALRR